MFTRILLLLALSLCCAAHGLEVKKTYGDHMVLQREKPVKICGRADKGTRVSVSFSKEGLQGEAVADERGEWCVTLPAQPAGGPWEVTVTDGREKIVFKDVLFGEVWICSGQSNMEMPLWSNRPFWRHTGGDLIAAKASRYPRIRFFNTPRVANPMGESSEPIGQWTLPTPEAAENFSALGYLFGLQLHHDLNVPVGLINGSWGGMPIRAFISEEALRNGGHEVLLAQLADIREYATAFEKLNAEERRELARSKNMDILKRWTEKFYSAVPREVQEAAAKWADPSFDDSKWDFVEAKPSATFTIDSKGRIGFMWLRTEVEIPADMAGKELQLYLGAVDDTDVTYFNGIEVGATGYDIPEFWALKRNYTVPASAVKAGRAVIALRYANSNGPSGLEHGDLHLAVKGDESRKVMLNRGWRWKLEYEVPAATAAGRPEPLGDVLQHKAGSVPTTIFNSMIAPWKTYPVRGEIWYQGEADAASSPLYFKMQQQMVEDRRKQWNDPDYGFFWCQLSSLLIHSPINRGVVPPMAEMDPNLNHVWSDFREMQQALTDRIRNSGIAVSIDCGNPFDVHPNDKSLLAFRLAREAERVFFGYKGVTSGPRYAGHEVEGNKVIISFTNTGSGLVTNNSRPLAGFAVAGIDGKFVWANAEIRGAQVVVSAPEVANPVFVRYAWLPYPYEANLANADGFPASPFRTNIPAYLLAR